MSKSKMVLICVASFTATVIIRTAVWPTEGGFHEKREPLALAPPAVGPTYFWGRRTAPVRITLYATFSCRPCRDTLRTLASAIEYNDPEVSVEVRVLPAS